MSRLLPSGINVSRDGKLERQHDQESLSVVYPEPVEEFDSPDLVELVASFTVVEVRELLGTGQIDVEEVKAAERLGKNRAGILSL